MATRVRILALGIDLAVVAPAADPKAFPYCDVAMYKPEFGQPGQGHLIYLYAHARTGMFLPLLDASNVQDGKSMLGMVVEVWTSDDQRFLYDITRVIRHVKFNAGIQDTKTEQLWLQTSEGPTQDRTQAAGRRAAAVAGGGRPGRRPSGGKADGLPLRRDRPRSARVSPGARDGTAARENGRGARS